VYSQNFSVSAQDTASNRIAFNTTALRCLLLVLVGDDVYEYDLSTGFDVSTASLLDSFSVAAQETGPTRISL
jgi:hypothetical protein